MTHFETTLVSATIHGECAREEHETNFKNRDFIRIENPEDRWCLARAVLAGIKYYEEGQQRTPAFVSYCFQKKPHGKAAEKLLRDSSLPTDKAEYNLKDAEKIQDCLIRRFGEDEIRIVIFAKEYNSRIVWKGWSDRPAIFNLCLYLADNHYSFVGKHEHIFRVIL